MDIFIVKTYQFSHIKAFLDLKKLFLSWLIKK